MLDLLVLGVLGMNLYALLLVVLRAPLYGTVVYRPMLLNIGLSIAPVLVLGVFVVADLALVAGGAPPWITVTVAVVGALVWLLLLPNAGYLVTELNLSHRKDGERVPLWYDIVLVLTLAMSGVLNTVVNVLLVQVLYAVVRFPDDTDPFARPASWLVAFAILLLVTAGIYLGRYVRFNSWDLLHPLQFVRKLVRHLRERGAVVDALLFCLLHTVFLTLMYVVVIGTVVRAIMVAAS
ncbi:DUF1361 domain-containing protein [Oerskovia flava]|uniref:DUF1361 domain-containing protein n=1 Tax=Oerskovia flava TaxID=2986422 RepID=UPI00224079E5|nr:DUF1361 domain-containing protein [Oerskovia sp. JB1-3-2]